MSSYPQHEAEWSGRPLRNLTTQELERALEDRQNTLISLTSRMASELCQIEIEKLQVELRGRSERTVVHMGFNR